MTIRHVSKLLAHATAVVALGVSAQSFAYDQVIDETPSAEAMTFDLLIVRPLGLVGTIAGCVVFVASLPFDLLTFNFVDPARRLVIEPAKFTFTRDLGEMH